MAVDRQEQICNHLITTALDKMNSQINIEYRSILGNIIIR